MNFLDRVIPNFLKKIDRHLLLNHRLIWESKFHYVLFYGMVGIGLSVLIGTIYPISTTRDVPMLEPFIILTIVPSVILLAFWVYKQYQHSIEHDFGNLGSFMGQKRMAIYTISAMFFVAPTVILPNMIYNRVGNMVEEANMEADKIILNEGNPFFPVKDTYRRSPDNIHDFLECNKDSYNCNRGQIFNRFGGDEKMPLSYENSERLREMFVYQLDKEEATLKIEAYLATMAKYGHPLNTTSKDVLDYFRLKKGDVDYRLDNIKTNVERKMRKLNRFTSPILSKREVYPFWGSLLIGFLCFATLFQFIKSVTLRELVITVVSAIGLGIASVALMSLLWEFRLVNIRDEELITVAVLGIYAFTMYHAAGVSFLHTYSRFKTIMLSMANLATPFLVLWVAVTLDQWHILDVPHSADDIVNYLLAGFAIYGIFFFSWFRKLHLRMRSLPKV